MTLLKFLGCREPEKGPKHLIKLQKTSGHLLPQDGNNYLLENLFPVSHEKDETLSCTVVSRRLHTVLSSAPIFKPFAGILQVLEFSYHEIVVKSNLPTFPALEKG